MIKEKSKTILPRSEELKEKGFQGKNWDRINNAETEREARLEVLSQNKKELRSQVSRIKETITKILIATLFSLKS